MHKAVFIDRDGTLNVAKESYVFRIEDFEVYPDVVEGMKLLSKTDYKLIIISNQAGIAKKLYAEKDTEMFNEHLKKFIIENDGRIDCIYYCPHQPQDSCDCRKPGTGMLIKAKNDFNLDLKKSFVIGDQMTDIEMGKRAGCKTILIKTGYGGDDKKIDVKPDFTAENLLEAANIILENEN